MAYELNKLADKLKSKGLDIAEDSAKLVLDSVVEFVQEEALASGNKLDDILIPLLGAMKPFLDAQVDKIDGQVG